MQRMPTRPGCVHSAVWRTKTVRGQTRRCGLVMPSNREKNQHFGVYRNVCCGREIIIREGATFPDCENHPKLPTVWEPVEVEIADVIVIQKKSKSDPAA